MGYLHISNLYKDRRVLECSPEKLYVLEKIHGTSAHIKWIDGKLSFFSGGEKHDRFTSIFDTEKLATKLFHAFGNIDVIIYGEAYGGKQQGMGETYGKELKFIAFDVFFPDESVVANQKGRWATVPDAHNFCNNLGIEFVWWECVTTDLDLITALKETPSVQAYRNGCGYDKPKKGIILRPLVEQVDKHGERVIAKYKNTEFSERENQPKPKEIDLEKLQVLTDAAKIAEEWVVQMRMEHVLQKHPEWNDVKYTGDVVKAMIEDVFREANGEIVKSKEVERAIGHRASKMFRDRVATVKCS